MITTKPIDIEDAHADILQNALKKHLPESVRVYAFGSRANWQAKRASDLDLAIDASDILKRNIGDLEEELSQSSLPYRVDIVNLNSISNSFREAISADLVTILWDWEEVTLGDYLNVKHGYAFKGKYITQEPTSDILVTPGNFFIGGGFKNNKFKYFNSDYPEEYILNKDDIVITMTDLSKEGDTLGYAAKIPEERGKKFLHNQRIGLVELLSNDIDKNFIYWLMRTKDYQCFIIGASSGTSIRHTSPTSIKSYSCLFPTLPEQKAIAAVLSSLDDKIDLLHRQNKTLESIAETIFRQWFIEEADDGWFYDELKNYVTVVDNRGKTPINSQDITPFPLIEVNALGKKNRLVDYSLIKKYLTKDTFDNWFRDQPKKYDTLLSTVGSIGAISMYVLAIGNIAQNIIGLSAKNISAFYLYQFLKHNIHEILLLDIGGVQPSIKVPHLLSLEIPIPPIDLQYAFDYKIINLVSKMEVNYNQIKTLETLRNTLLPKLMSGDIRVKYEATT